MILRVVSGRGIILRVASGRGIVLRVASGRGTGLRVASGRGILFFSLKIQYCPSPSSRNIL